MGATRGRHPFDRHLVIRLLAYLRPYSRADAAAFWSDTGYHRLRPGSPYLTK